MTKPSASGPLPPSPLPVLRAAVFAVVGVVLGVSAHHVAAEGPVPWRQGAMAGALLFGVGLAGTRKHRSPVAVVTVCGTAQAALHLWLMATHTEAAPHHAMHAHGSWHGRVHASPAMTAVHALAAVLVALLLHRADAVCWSLSRGLTSAVDTVRRRIATALTLLSGRPADPTRTRPVSALAWWSPPPPGRAALTDVVIRRGPPQAGFLLPN